MEVTLDFGGYWSLMKLVYASEIRFFGEIGRLERVSGKYDDVVSIFGSTSSSG